MARLHSSGDDGSTKEMERAKTALLGVLTDAADTVADDHDRSPITHHSTGHDQERRSIVASPISRHGDRRCRNDSWEADCASGKT
jgi:hypothetical protein